MNRIIRIVAVLGVIAAVGVNAQAVHAQISTFSRDELIEYTPLWQGERFPDGRPKVPDDVLDKLKDIVIDDAILVLKENGYICQYEDGFVSTHTRPLLIGRAVTCIFMPERPDVAGAITSRHKADGVRGANNSVVVNTVVPGDVIVADMYGKIENTFAGGGVSGTINRMGGRGLVIDGGCLDKEEILATIPDFTIYVRGWHPTHLSGVMLTGMNCPVRIGEASVMPGDVVMGGHEGVLFIPPHLAAEIVKRYGKK